MKVAIITIQDINNYGNRLQNYATQYILEKKGYKVVSLMNSNQSGNVYIKGKVKYLSGLYHSTFFAKYIKHDMRLYNFILFNKKNIKFSKEFYNKSKQYKNLDKKYNYFFVGSDQVWNSSFHHAKRLDLLEDVDYDKSISLSASVGVSKLNDKDIKRFKKALPNIKYISVREDKAKELLQPFTKSKIKVLIDPTMMLTVSEWEKLEIRPNFLKNKNYIVVYCLGNMSVERTAFINRIAKENNYEIIDLMNSSDIAYISGPSEFLYLIHHAKLVCTDSFHACVFSILFDTQFYVFEREDKLESMNSRIETLLNKFALNEHRKKDYIEYSINHDYTNVYKILENERMKFNLFLDNCFGGKK